MGSNIFTYTNVLSLQGVISFHVKKGLKSKVIPIDLKPFLQNTKELTQLKC